MTPATDSSVQDERILGIHHVTAIASDPQANLDFYTAVLGLRLVKKTVNFDDPSTYHLYYGDEVGHPGTILTFFPWPGARRGSRGAGQVTVISLSVPQGSLGYWLERLEEHDVAAEKPHARFDEDVVVFLDPDGLKLELVTHQGPQGGVAWEGGPVPPAHGIRGLCGVTLLEWSVETTGTLLTETMGFHQVEEKENRFRFDAEEGGPGARIDILEDPDATPGRIAAGTVHHVAFRVRGEEEQKSWRGRIIQGGLYVTPVLDRNYFRSIYFREPGGVLFELATDPPGFTADEPVEALGTAFKLPPWLENSRTKIEEGLPELKAPRAARV